MTATTLERRGSSWAQNLPTARPRPEWWIHLSWSLQRAKDKAIYTGIYDEVHRGPRCPVSYLNVPWRLVDDPLHGVAGALDLLVIDPHMRMCGHCFTETEIKTMGTDLAYYRAPEQPLEDRHAYALLVKDSPSLPEKVRGNPASVLLAMDLADALMIRRGVALTQMHFMAGVPVPNANLINGLVRRAGHRLRVKEGRNDAGIMFATAYLTRKDDPDFTYEVTWDMDRAKSAGLDQRPAWKISPQANLKRRAITEVARDACPEVFMGMDLNVAADFDITEADGPDDIPAGSPTQGPADAADDGIEDAVVVGEEDDQELAVARDEVKKLVDHLGWSTVEMRRAYEAEVGGKPEEGSVEQLGTFKAYLERQLAALAAS